MSEKAENRIAEDHYSIREAAAYLGLSMATIKYHVYVSGHLRPGRFAGVRVFTQDDLDEFARKKEAGEMQPGPKPKE